MSQTLRNIYCTHLLNERHVVDFIFIKLKSLIMKLYNRFKYFILLFCLAAVGAILDEEFGQIKVLLQHSFDQGPNVDALTFTDRGSVSFWPMKLSKFNAPIEVELTKNEQLKLIDLVKNDGFYRIRAPIKTNDSLNYIYTFIRACALYESDLSDVITLHTDINGDLIGISATTNNPLCEGSINPSAHLKYFKTVIEIRPMETGPAPDAAAFIQKVEKEKSDRAKNEQGDNRSFFSKYWMYIVPAVVFMLITQVFSPDPQGGGGGR